MMFFNKKRSKAGQSTVEYILGVTAVIAVGVLFLTQKNVGLQNRVHDSYNKLGVEMADKAETLSESHTDQGNVTASPPVPKDQTVTIPPVKQIK